ncbi:MAG: hypothetical protein FWC38_04675 [Proteobacteria bacterium]|nr:hypothetical protein [Pseudomonadota bacterium]
MKTKRLTPAQRRQLTSAPDIYSPQSVGLAQELYAAAIRYLFDRLETKTMGQEWFWNIDEPFFDATPLEWVRIQTVLFANAGADLAAYSDEQVGMGLNCVMSNCISDIPHAAHDPSVPLDEAMRMMRAMPALWRDCIGPRLASLRAPIGSSKGRLAFVCYMWFDVWPTFWHMRHEPRWRDAVWQVLNEMLAVPCREVQIAALHGIGDCGRDLQRQDAIDRRIDVFIRSIDKSDQELRDYADAARQGAVL